MQFDLHVKGIVEAVYGHAAGIRSAKYPEGTINLHRAGPVCVSSPYPRCWIPSSGWHAIGRIAMPPIPTRSPPGNCKIGLLLRERIAISDGFVFDNPALSKLLATDHLSQQVGARVSDLLGALCPDHQ
jgi:hypothetical protein